jgi:hypothetical protein
MINRIHLLHPIVHSRKVDDDVFSPKSIDIQLGIQTLDLSRSKQLPHGVDYFLGRNICPSERKQAVGNKNKVDASVEVSRAYPSYQLTCVLQFLPNHCQFGFENCKSIDAAYLCMASFNSFQDGIGQGHVPFRVVDRLGNFVVVICKQQNIDDHIFDCLR